LLGWADAVFGFLRQVVLNNPVFQGMETDNCQSSAGGQYRCRLRQGTAQRFQFIVHGNAQCLEGSRSRVNPGPTSSTYRPCHQVGQFLCAAYWTGSNDGASDAPAASFFAERYSRSANSL
jgi:hypothetical protein